MKNLTYKAVENSKNTSGESGNNPAGGSGQLTAAQITELVDIAKEMGCTHFGNHLFMDTNTQMSANYSGYSANYNLRTLETDTQLWADTVHAAGMKNIYRGTFSGIKANNDFPVATYGGANFIPLGTVAGAATEGETTYCGKVYRFMNTNVGASRWQDDDIMAPISEFTEYLSNSDYRWFNNTAGDQTAVQTFFTTIKDVVDAYGTSIGKNIKFFSIVNYSEYRTGYLGSTLPADSGFIASDYYGHYGYSNGQNAEPAAYVVDWNAMRDQVGGGGFPIFQTELGGIFGDSWPTIGATPALLSRKITTYEESAKYQMDKYKAYRDSLVDTGKMNGVMNWGFWSGQNSSIVRYTGGHYYPNYMGQIYANFIKGGGMTRIPVPAVTSGLLDSTGNRSVYF